MTNPRSDIFFLSREPVMKCTAGPIVVAGVTVANSVVGPIVWIFSEPV